MLPTVGSDSLKIIRYAAEVAGRTLGIAAMANLVPDAARRAALETAGNLINGAAQQLVGAYFARLTFENFDQRRSFGKGRSIDRGFDAAISTSSEKIRTSLPDRSTSNPDYRAIFPHGAEEFTSPTVKEDADLADNLHAAVSESNLTVKTEVLTLLDTIIPVVGPAATEIVNGEKQLNSLFLSEQTSRKLVVDTLWEQRKAVETALGRGGRGLARFVFFDFRKSGEGDAADATQPPDAPAPPADPNAPAPPIDPSAPK
jgi:hypothetical protein